MADSHLKPADTYSPLYFLASLGAGGVTVSFFMFLLFWVPHPGRTVPVYEDIATAFTNGSTALQAAIVIACIGIAVFAIQNLKSLFWNLSAMAKFKKTEKYQILRGSNAESTLTAQPLALAMSVNALFIVGLVFVPGLWGVVEYLFPLAMLAFAAIAVLTFRVIADFLGRVLSKGGLFDVTAHNSFAQLLPAFAIAMIAVGFAAPAAMSANPVTVGISLIASTLLGVAAVIYTVLAATTAVSSMLHYGTAREAAPTLMIIVPLMTVLGIMLLRQNHGLHVVFGAHSSDGETLILLARLLAVQVTFLALGMLVLNRQNYFTDFVTGPKTSPGSYALVCPAVALSVMLQFFVNKGLVANGLVEKFGAGYWVITGLAVLAQLIAIALVLRLNRQHFSQKKAPVAAIPAE